MSNTLNRIGIYPLSFSLQLSRLTCASELRVSDTRTFGFCIGGTQGFQLGGVTL